jgi:hypothetical protein
MLELGHTAVVVIDRLEQNDAEELRLQSADRGEFLVKYCPPAAPQRLRDERHKLSEWPSPLVPGNLVFGRLADCSFGRGRWRTGRRWRGFVPTLR